MRRKILALVLFSIVISLFAWSPWLTPSTASKLTENQFNKAWYGVMDGCGTYGDNLGVQDFQKIPFGAIVNLDYQCGLVMPDEAALHTTVYVSFFGIAFGYPKP
jgi:hypothetical protein